MDIAWFPKRYVVNSNMVELAKTLPLFRNLRFDGGVEVYGIRPHYFLLTDGHCDWHDDKHHDSKWIAILIVRNDSNSWVETLSLKSRNKQLGRIVLFDCYKRHRLNQEGGEKNGKSGVWAALECSFDKKPTKIEVEKCFADKSYLIRS